MDAERFDRLSRTFATLRLTRRAMLKAFAALAGTVATTVPSQTRASSPKFLTLPFGASARMRVQQGFTSSFEPHHNGIDYINGNADDASMWKRFDVLAAADGEACANCISCSSCSADDISIGIYHPAEGLWTYYNHLHSIAPTIAGSTRSHRVKVSRGDIIGVAGATGIAGHNESASQPWIHLHFGLATSGFTWPACGRTPDRPRPSSRACRSCDRACSSGGHRG